MRPSEELANTIRYKIMSGQLRPGERLASVKDLAAQVGVAGETARRAYLWLEAAHLVVIKPQQGVWVADDPGGPTVVPSALDLLKRVHLTGSATTDDEHVEVVSAAIVASNPPGHIRQIFDLEPWQTPVRREYVTRLGAHIRRLTVDWYAPSLLETVAELLDKDENADYLRLINERSERWVSSGSEESKARGANNWEAKRLGIEPGSPILASANQWSDQEGELLVYSEWCVPPNLGVRHEYEDVRGILV